MFCVNLYVFVYICKQLGNTIIWNYLVYIKLSEIIG